MGAEVTVVEVAGAIDVEGGSCTTAGDTTALWAHPAASRRRATIIPGLGFTDRLSLPGRSMPNRTDPTRVQELWAGGST